jgi:hypothetical protein
MGVIYRLSGGGGFRDPIVTTGAFEVGHPREAES